MEGKETVGIDEKEFHYLQELPRFNQIFELIAFLYCLALLAESSHLGF